MRALRVPCVPALILHADEMRVYGFEIFECFRKMLLILVPIFFEPDSPEQLTVGLIVCFATYGMYMMYAPYQSERSDMLAQVCQVQIFFSLLSSIVLKTNPESVAMGYILPFMMVVPPVLAVLFQCGCIDRLVRVCAVADNGVPTPCGRVGVGIRSASVKRLERCLGVKHNGEQEVEEDIENLEEERADSAYPATMPVANEQRGASLGATCVAADERRMSVKPRRMSHPLLGPITDLDAAMDGKQLETTVPNDALHMVFQRFDKNKNGTLEYRELRDALRHLDFDVSHPVAANFIKLYDDQPDGRMQASEFRECVRNLEEGFVRFGLPSGGGSTHMTRPPSHRDPDATMPVANEQRGASLGATCVAADERRMSVKPRRMSHPLLGPITDLDAAMDGKQLETTVPNDALHMVFQRFDKNKNGTLEYRELRDALRHLDFDVSHPVAANFIKLYDDQPDGRMQASEFRECVRNLEEGFVRFGLPSGGGSTHMTRPPSHRDPDAPTSEFQADRPPSGRRQVRDRREPAPSQPAAQVNALQSWLDSAFKSSGSDGTESTQRGAGQGIHPLDAKAALAEAKDRAVRLAATAAQAEEASLNMSAIDIQARFRANLARKATQKKTAIMRAERRPSMIRRMVFDADRRRAKVKDTSALPPSQDLLPPPRELHQQVV